MRAARFLWATLALFTLGLTCFGPLTTDTSAAPLYTFESVVTQGAPTPVGGTFSASGFGPPALNRSGWVAYRSGIEGAAATMGIFLSVPGEGARAVALDGQLAPGGGTFADFLGVGMDDLGRVVFGAHLDGGDADAGIFMVEETGNSRLVATGDPAPGGDGSFTALFELRVTPQGRIFVHALASGGPASGGILAVEEGETQWVAHRGQEIPETGRIVWIGAYGANDAGDVAFVGRVEDDLGMVTGGIFLASHGILSRVLTIGEATPMGGVFQGFHAPSLNALGQIGFAAAVSGGSAPVGLFVLHEGGVALVAGQGQPAPAPASGSFERFERPRLDESGALRFESHLSGGATPGGIFKWAEGALAAELLSLEPLPGGGRLFHPRLFQENDQGTLAFRADVLGPRPGGIFVKVLGAGIQPIARFGQATPAGGTYADSSLISTLNNSGAVAFEASVLGGLAPEGIFVRDASGTVAVALWGDMAPEGLDGRLGDLEAPSLGDSGEVAFVARLAESTSPKGIFLAQRTGDGYGLQAVALKGQSAPDGSLYGPLGRPEVVGAGGVLFRALLLGDETAYGAILLRTPKGVEKLLQQGDPAPSDVGGSFGALGRPAGNATGQVLFWARVLGGTARSGLFLRDRAGEIRTVVADGGATPLGGRFAPLFRSYDVNDSGEVLFVAPISGGVSQQGIFLWRDGLLDVVVAEGWTLPGKGKVRGFGHAAINGSSDVVFQAAARPQKKGGIFMATAEGIRPVVRPGERSPVGGRFGAPNLPAVNDQGQIAFRALVSGKRSSRGIFLASEVAGQP